MPMFNTVAIRIHPVAGATRAEVVRDAVAMATRLRNPVVFDWNGVNDFVVWPEMNGNGITMLLDARMKAKSREFSVKQLALPMATGDEDEISKATEALAKLHDLEPEMCSYAGLCIKPLGHEGDHFDLPKKR